MIRSKLQQHCSSRGILYRSNLIGRAITSLLASLFIGMPLEIHASKSTKPLCLITEFRTIGRSVHHPDLRHAAGMRWLRLNLPHCSLEQVKLLGANRTQWYGTADDAELAGVIDQAAELLASEKPELLKSLFTSASSDQMPSAQNAPNVSVFSTRTARPAADASQAAAQAYQQSQQQYTQQYQQQYQQQYPQQYQQAYPQQYQQPSASTQGGNPQLPTQ